MNAKLCYNESNIKRKAVKMKKITSLLLVLVLLTSFITPIFAVENEVNVTLDGFELTFDVPARIIGDRTMVPVRAIFEALGATVSYDGETKTVSAVRGEDTITLTIGKNELYKNGELAYTMDVVPVIIEENGESRTLVPARAVSEAFGATVEWDGESASAIITNIDDTTVMLIDGYPVDLDTYYYYISAVLYNKMAERDSLADDEAVNALKAEALDMLLTDFAKLYIGKSVGFTPYMNTISQKVTSAFDAYKTTYGENFGSVLEESFLTEDVFKTMLMIDAFEYDVLSSLQSSFEYMTDQQLADSLLLSGIFMNAYHILLETEEEAEKLLETAKAVLEHGTDPGMKDNADGYYFIKNQMVKEFEEATLALEVGGTSDIVKSEYGYHIIRRLPIDREFVAHNVRDMYIALLQNLYSNSILEAKEILSKKILNIVKEDPTNELINKYFDKYEELFEEMPDPLEDVSNSNVAIDEDVAIEITDEEDIDSDKFKKLV